MAGFQNALPEFEALGAKVATASVDPIEKAGEVAAQLSFPHAYGVTRETADLLGAWWEERRGFMQPAEFILDEAGRVLASSYSAGPLGRMDAADVVRLIRMYEARKAEVKKG